MASTPLRLVNEENISKGLIFLKDILPMGVDDDRDGHEGVQYLGWSYEGSWNDGQ